MDDRSLTIRFSLLLLALAVPGRARAGCPDLPPMPSPGGQVTWTAADSPFQVCQDLTVAPGSTVLVEPGVTIGIDAGATLSVQGTLLGPGTAGSPILFTGGRVKVSGRLELDHGTLNSQMIPQDGGGSMLFRDCHFQADQLGSLTEITEPTYIWDNPPLVSLDRCTFDGDGSGWEFLLDNCHVVLRDTDFTGTRVELWDSYVWLDNVTCDGGMVNLFFVNVDAHQDVYVDNLSARNHPGGAGLAITGANALLGPNNVLEQNLYPVSVSGLLPGSVVPLTGNGQNLIHASSRSPGAVWADAGLPWYYDSTSGCTSVFPDIEPGVTVKTGPDAWFCQQGGRMLARGLPGAPITFEPLTPGSLWEGITIHVSFGSQIDNCVIDGARFGLIVTNAGGWLLDSVVRNCVVGANTNTYGVLQAFKSQFLDNDTGIANTDLGGMWLDSATNPNSFVGNTVGVGPMEFGADVDAAHSWWGDPSGPTTPLNPGGQGDSIGPTGSVTFQPFLTEAPDYDNHPPVVRLAKNDRRPAYAVHALYETGAKFIVEWTAEDDDQIVEQQVLFSQAGDFDGDFNVVATLPPGQRSFEWTVADVPFIVNGAASYLRVVAVDSTGQVGWDQIAMGIPSEPATSGQITSDFGGQTFRSGSALPTFMWAPPMVGTPYFFILLDGDEKSIYLGGGGSGTWVFTDSPFASTDTARLAIRGTGSLNNVNWVFGEYFSLRPDPQIGDAPPSVTLTSPAGGSSYAGGSVVPITWTASDDEALGSFKIQASYDGGRTWHVIARDLPPDATRCDWPLPPSEGIDDVRVRVVAFDRRFQNSSDGTDNVVSITPGGQPVAGDANGDGIVNVTDLVAVITSWGPCPGCPADVNGDGVVDVLDLLTVILYWS